LFNTTDKHKFESIKILQLQEKPEPFAPGNALFWNDPYISKQMLKYHLSEDTDAASRKGAMIQKIVDWVVDYLQLKSGDRLLDLGCGPGLYAAQFAKKGLQVTGIDFSSNSIEYAKKHAQEHQLDLDYQVQNYLTLNLSKKYDVVCLIYGDFCTFSLEQRKLILENVQNVLKPGGYFVFDVTTREHRKQYGNKNNWYAAKDGFWKAGVHLVLEEGFDYPEHLIYLDQYVVIDEEHNLHIYRNWFQDYDPQLITTELTQNGFLLNGYWNDLSGSPYREDTQWIGVVAQKPK